MLMVELKGISCTLGDDILHTLRRCYHFKLGRIFIILYGLANAQYDS